MDGSDELSTYLDLVPIHERQIAEFLSLIREQRNHALIVGGAAFVAVQILFSAPATDAAASDALSASWAAGKFQIALNHAAPIGVGSDTVELLKYYIILAAQLGTAALAFVIFSKVIAIYGRPIPAGRDPSDLDSIRIHRFTYIKSLTSQLTDLSNDWKERKNTVRSIDFLIRAQFVLLSLPFAVPKIFQLASKLGLA